MAVSILSVALISFGYAQGRPATVEALDGVDPVLLVQGKEVSGRQELKVVRGGFEYLFVSAETKATFENSPYSILNAATGSIRVARRAGR